MAIPEAMSHMDGMERRRGGLLVLAVASLAIVVALVGEKTAGSSFVTTTVGRATNMDFRGSSSKSLSPVPELRASVSPAVLGYRSSGSGSNFSWFAAGAAVVALGLSMSTRDESCTTMYGAHDIRSRRGKIHRGSFGKHRMRKTKLHRLRNIRAGAYVKGEGVQWGQPEPEHPWHPYNLLQNPMIKVHAWARPLMEDAMEAYFKVMRKDWKELMGKKGDQVPFKNWTPPELEGKA